MKLNDKEITELAQNLAPKEQNAFPNHSDADIWFNGFIECFKKCQSMNECVDCNDFRNFIRTHHLSHLWDEYCKNNSIEPTPPIK